MNQDVEEESICIPALAVAFFLSCCYGEAYKYLYHKLILLHL